MSNNIVQQFEGELRVSSETIAERTGVQHKNVLDLVNSYYMDLEQFGPIAFEARMGNRGGVPVRVAHLDEQQSTLIITYMRNSELVREFKMLLVKQFYEMRTALTMPKSIEQRSLELITELNDRMLAQSAQLEEQKPLVQQALTYQGGDNLTARQAFSREIIAWAVEQGHEVKQQDVFRFLSYKLGLFVRGERADAGEATVDAIRRGLAITQKGTSGNGHNYATGKLTPAGKAYAWERIVRYLEQHGTLRILEAVA